MVQTAVLDQSSVLIHPSNYIQVPEIGNCTFRSKFDDVPIKNRCPFVENPPSRHFNPPFLS
jgi:hypothetical protein